MEKQRFYTINNAHELTIFTKLWNQKYYLLENKKWLTSSEEVRYFQDFSTHLIGATQCFQKKMYIIIIKVALVKKLFPNTSVFTA